MTQLAGSGTIVSADVSALGSRQGQVIFRFYTYANSGEIEPDQRGFRGSASGGVDLEVHGIVIGPVGVPDLSGLAFRLDPVRPNPALRGATIGFSIPASRNVELSIFDVQGRRVRTVLKEERAAGEHSARWDGLTDRGAAAISGVYFAVLTAGTLHATRSVVLLR